MPLSHYPLFALAIAHAPTGWTDKEVLGYLLSAVGGTCLVLIPVAWGLVKILSRKAERQAARMEAENRGLRRKVAEFEDSESAEELRQKLADSTKAVGHLETTLEQVRKQAEG